MEDIQTWMNSHFLKINPDKTELLLLYPKTLENQVIIRGTILGDNCISFSEEVKNVGFWLDCNLNMDKHVNKIVSHCYKLLKDIGRIRSVITKEQTEKLVHAVIGSRLDYCNSLLFGINKFNINKLQKVRNTAARLLERKPRRHSATLILRDLHWFKVKSRIIFIILLIMFKLVKVICHTEIDIKYKRYNCRPDDLLLLEEGENKIWI